MRLIIAAVLVCIATSAYAGGWCAYYDFGVHDGYRKCGFTSLEQCGLGCAWRWRQLRTQSVFVLSETSLQAVRCTGAFSQPADCHYEQSHGSLARRFRRRGQSRRQRCRVLPMAASLRAELHYARNGDFGLLSAGRAGGAGALDYGPGATRATGTLVFPYIFGHARPELKTHRRV